MTTATARRRVVLRTSSPARFTLDPARKPIVASGKVVAMADYRYPAEPPRSWFAKAENKGAYPVVVEADGRIHGYAWEWRSEHIGNRAIKPPRSRSNYGHFLTKHTLCDDGTQVRTGPVYIHCDHADLSLNEHQAREAMAHTGTAVADIAVYEDRFGGQLAGALRPDVTPAEVRTLRGSDLSPDWRPMRGGGHEMVGLIAVNTSGFIVPIVASGNATPIRVADGRPRVQWDHVEDEPLAIVAVGILRHKAPDPIDVLRKEMAEVREFMAGLRADEVMGRFAQSDSFRSFDDRAAAVVSRAEAILADAG